MTFRRYYPKIQNIILQSKYLAKMFKYVLILLALNSICLAQEKLPPQLAQLPGLSKKLQQFFASTSTSTTSLPSFPLPFSVLRPTVNGNQIKQVQYKLEPFINQYVVATIFNKNEELFGIETKNGTPSWIYLDEDVKEHQTCFEDIFNVQFNLGGLPPPEENEQTKKQQNKDTNNINSFLCLPVDPIKCMGECKKLGELTTTDKQQQEYLVGDNLYEVHLMSMGFDIKKSFISASSFTVKSYHKGLLSTDDINFGQYWVRDFYVSIIGQINIADFQYLMISHHKEGDNDYYMSDRESFDDFPLKSIVQVQPNTTAPGSAITKITLQDQTLLEKHLKYEVRFNSSQLSIGLPESLYNALYKQIFQQLFQSKCTSSDPNIYTCTLNKSKQLWQTILSFCIGESKPNSTNCIEISLADVLVMWDDQQQQAKTEESYQYFYLVGKEVESNTITFYPEFGVIYKILVKEGDVYGFVRHQTEQIDHIKEKKAKKQPEHEHHEHVEQNNPLANTASATNTGNPDQTQTSTTSNANTDNSPQPNSQQPQTNPNKYSADWPILLILVIVFALFVIGYGCYKFMNDGNEGQIGQAEIEAEQGDLIDGKGKGRKKIFKPVESVEMVATNENIASPDSPDSPKSPEQIQKL